MESSLLDFISFLEKAPTSFHAVKVAAERLVNKGFIELKEQDAWKLELGQKYFVIRQCSSICAFEIPRNIPMAVRLLASHTDSPSFKLKPSPEIRRQNMLLFGVEVYGSPIISSWMNRDLGIAGRIIFKNRHDVLEQGLICLDQAPITIPHLAIHLDREVNEKGPQINKQEHLNALAALVDDSWPTSKSYLDYLIHQKIDYKELLGFDLFLYPLEKAAFIGYDRQMISGYRLDNLASLHASLEALVNGGDSLENEIRMMMSWDHEEIGSNTPQGASSAFLLQILERITLAMNLSREDYFRVLNNSICISIDMAHAVHPNYMEKHDANHQPLLGEGVILKSNAQKRYATDAFSSLPVRIISDNLGLPLQQFVSRNDIPCGTTVGPINAAMTGIPTVDLGCGQLSMHACRELMATKDYLHLCETLRQFLAAELPRIQWS